MVGVRKHFTKTHSNLHRCPICNKEVNNLAKHLTKMKNDVDHLVIWCLYDNLRGIKDNKLKSKIRRIVKEKLR
ncbi:hypothetical protein GFB69_13060 [Acidianus ambivalens]|uniref:Uncharacterized protein n=2 Tax=Acidianus ambivalens TaxID=2283 RepID=A0A6G1T6M3_ACIAM|nr:hypothetical protein [Acidianus ambivalens]